MVNILHDNIEWAPHSEKNPKPATGYYNTCTTIIYTTGRLTQRTFIESFN